MNNNKEKNDNSSDDNKCTICYNTLPTNPSKLDCGHEFCPDCLNDWLYGKAQKNTCPLCRAIVDPNRHLPPEDTTTANDILRHFLQMVDAPNENNLAFVHPNILSDMRNERNIFHNIPMNNGRVLHRYVEVSERQTPQLSNSMRHLSGIFGSFFNPPNSTSSNNTNNPNLTSSNNTNNPNLTSSNNTNNSNLTSSNNTNNPNLTSSNNTNNPNLTSSNNTNNSNLTSSNNPNLTSSNNTNNPNLTSSNNTNNSENTEEYSSFTNTNILDDLINYLNTNNNLTSSNSTSSNNRIRRSRRLNRSPHVNMNTYDSRRRERNIRRINLAGNLNNNLNSSNEEHEQFCDTVKNQITQLQNHIRFLRRENENNKKRIKEVENENNNLKNKINNLNNKLNELDDERFDLN